MFSFGKHTFLILLFLVYIIFVDFITCLAIMHFFIRIYIDIHINIHIENLVISELKIKQQ